MAQSFNKFETFVGDLGLETHELHADVLKVYLSNAAPSAASDSVRGDCLEISSGNGYTTGGMDVTNTYTESGGTGTLGTADITWTASSGNIGPFQYAILYNSTSGASDGLIGWWDYSSAVTLTTTETFKVAFASSTAFTIA